MTEQQQPTAREALIGLVVGLPGVVGLAGMAWFVYGWFAEDGVAILGGLAAFVGGAFICGLVVKLQERYKGGGA